MRKAIMRHVAMTFYSIAVVAFVIGECASDLSARVFVRLHKSH